MRSNSFSLKGHRFTTEQTRETPTRQKLFLGP